MRKTRISLFVVYALPFMMVLAGARTSVAQNDEGPGIGPASASTPGRGVYFAVVDFDGTLARNRRAVDANNLFPGEYEVIFKDNVRRCAYTASIGLSGSFGTEQPGEITVVGRAANVRGVFVTTHDSAGAPADRGFHLVVNCRP